MTKTNELRKLVKKLILPVCSNVFYEMASAEDLYPHIVFSFSGTDKGDLYRDDISMYVDIWDKSKNAEKVEELSDNLEEVFNNQNLPQDSILPTFFVSSRTAVADEDKQIRHRMLTIQIQNYERKE